MAQTRPSGYPILADPSVPVLQEPAQLDGRGRLNLLPRWTSRISWWNALRSDDLTVLMVLVEPGLLSLQDLRATEPRITARYEELRAIGDKEALDAIRLMQDRYKRLTIDAEHRIHVGDAALAHLDLSLDRGTKATVYVAVFADRLDIFSADYRNQKLLIGSSHLDDLP